MKILHINQSDIIGGAGIAGYRLHRGLLTRSVDSRLIVGRASTDSPLVEPLPRHRCLYGILESIGRLIGLNYSLIPQGFGITKHDFYRNADIVNLHNLHGSYINYLAIGKIASKRPTVFTLHDMWSFTGHCTYSYDCERWKTGCGKCPYPETPPRIRIDNTRLELKLKRKIYKKCNLTVVTPSKWLANLASESILSRHPIKHIPNGIDVSIYRPLDVNQCRSFLDIPKSAKVIMLSAADLRDPRKGMQSLIDALSTLPDSFKRQTILLTLGKDNRILDKAGIRTIGLGYVESEHMKAVAYSSADVFVLPSLADNFPLVLQESLACGIPMVSYRVGGIPEIVRQEDTGLLSEPDDFRGLRDSIIRLFTDNGMRMSMKKQCREVALKEFSLELQVDRYIALYKNILS